MSRGGLRKDKKGTTNHLFKPKWNNKKTTAIRVPEAFKFILLEMARYLDKTKISNIESKEILDDLANCFRYKKLWGQYKNRLIEIRQEKKDLLKRNDELTKKLKQKDNRSNYQTAQEYFDEYLKSKNLDIDELSKSRKGSKKYQLFEIRQWFENY